MLSTAPTTYEASLKADYRAVHKRLNAGRVPIPIPENPAPSDVINSKSQGFADVSGTDRGGAPKPAKEWISAQDYIPNNPRSIAAFGGMTGKAKIATILRAASRYAREPVADILSNRHHARLVRPRHIVMYLSHELTTLSYPVIGRFLADRDHTTIMFGVNKIRLLIQSDQQLAADVAAIRALAVAADPGLEVVGA